MMQPENTWNNLTAQQLVRYEALFKLFEAIQGIEDIGQLSDLVARQWKYFAKITNWRLTVFQETSHVVIDGIQGKAAIEMTGALAEWDAYYQVLGIPTAIVLKDRTGGPTPPRHLSGPYTKEILVFPFLQGDQWVGLMSLSANRTHFNELDIKFSRIFGRYFADRIAAILRQKREKESLREKSVRDTLTGLHNHGFIQERLKEKLALAKRTGEPLTVILTDIDHFKAVNDTFGHQVGDLVLRQLACRLKDELRDSDNLGRYGGEEFMFVLYPCGPEEAAVMAERLRLAVADKPMRIDAENAASIDLTISIGASSAVPDGETECATIINTADKALYHSKAHGRNRVTISAPAP